MVKVLPPDIRKIHDVFTDNARNSIAQFKIVRDAVRAVKNGTEYGPWPLHTLEIRNNRVVCPLNGELCYFVQNWRISYR